MSQLLALSAVNETICQDVAYKKSYQRLQGTLYQHDIRDESEYEELVERLQRNPLHWCLHNLVKMEKFGVFPEQSFAIYSYCIDDNLYWFGYGNNGLSMPVVQICFDGTLNKYQFLDAFCQFNKIYRLFDRSDPYLILADIRCVDFIRSYIKKLDFDVKIPCDPRNIFYPTPEKEEYIRNAVARVPEGYVLEKPNLTDDAEYHTRVWLYGFDGGEELARLKFRSLPASCVRKDGKAVGIVSLKHTGSRGGRFVDKDHRMHGLGLVLELHCDQQTMSAGLRPHKYVACSNEPVIKSTLKQGIYTQALNELGNIAMIDYCTVNLPFEVRY